MSEFKSYKAINVYSSYREDYSYHISNCNHFSFVKLNNEFVSEILESAHCRIHITPECLDSFICFFLNTRIPMVEKNCYTDPLDGEIDIEGSRLNLLKKYWPNSSYGLQAINPNQFMNEIFVYTLEDFICNVVMMNNGSCYTVPLIN